MTRQKTGLINLDSDDLYAYGHITDDEATALVAEKAEDDGTEPYPCVVTHCYRRWVPVADEDFTSELRWSKPGRGAFKATLIRSVAEVERETEHRRKIAADTESLREWVMERFPLADVVRQSRYPDARAEIVFTLPGLSGSLDAQGIGTVFVAQRDLETFDRLYGKEST